MTLEKRFRIMRDLDILGHFDTKKAKLSFDPDLESILNKNKCLKNA